MTKTIFPLLLSISLISCVASPAADDNHEQPLQEISLQFESERHALDAMEIIANLDDGSVIHEVTERGFRASLGASGFDRMKHAPGLQPSGTKHDDVQNNAPSCDQIVEQSCAQGLNLCTQQWFYFTCMWYCPDPCW